MPLATRPVSADLLHGRSARTWCYLVRHHENGYGHAHDQRFQADRLRTRQGFPCRLTCRPGCKRDPAPNLTTHHLSQGSRLCDPWFEAWGPMPAGVQPGSGTNTSLLPIWPKVPGSATHGSRHAAPCRLGCNRDPVSPFGSWCPALLPMGRGMGSRVRCRLGCKGDPSPNIPAHYLAQGARPG